MARTIQSPGVEVNEVDLTTRPAAAGGTTVLVPGFASQGPTDEVLLVNSVNDLETVYGPPTNPAERYFHQTARAVFNSSSRVLTTRLPYGSGEGLGITDEYTALFYPVFAYTGEQGAPDASVYSAGVSLSGGNVESYVFGKPSLITMTKDDYRSLQQGNFTWSDLVKPTQAFTANTTTWGKAGIIVTNIAKTSINDKFEGNYLAIADNSQINPSTDYTGVRQAFSVNEQTSDLTLTIPEGRLNFPLSGTPLSNDESVSEILENIPGFDISSTEFDDTLTVGLFRLRTSVYSSDTIKLDYVMRESYIGSLDGYRKLQSNNGGTPRSFFLGDVEDGSGNIEIFVNPYISYRTGTWMTSGGNTPSKNARVLTSRAFTDSSNASLSGSFGIPAATISDLVTNGFKHADALYPLGTFQKADPLIKEIGSVPAKLERALRRVENVDLVDIDIITEAGLGTIYASAKDNVSYGPVGTDTFDDELTVNLGSYTTPTGLYQIKDGAVTTGRAYDYMTNYRAVYNKFATFAETDRADHMFIADAPRHILVQGANTKALDDATKTFTQAVYWPLRHIYSATNTSYAAVYGNWARVLDNASDRLTWAPFSGFAAATLANADRSFGPWYAPAGFTRGRLLGAVDIAVVPSQKHRDQLYKININPVTSFPGEGFVIYGQKTLFKKPSAFDRINVRRLFVYLEKIVRNTMKYYVFEPNTLLTRTSVLNNLTPIFENIRNQQGLFDYLIICDERNNTPNIIDQNELVVDIYLKPVRSAEMVLVNFYASRTGQDFREIVG